MTDVERFAYFLKSCINPVKVGICVGTVTKTKKYDGVTEISFDFKGEYMEAKHFYSIVSEFEKGDKVILQWNETNDEAFVFGKAHYFREED
jgi:hypothetical protein